MTKNKENAFLIKLKSLWKDPVISKIIAFLIIGIISSIPLILQKFKGVPIQETLNKELTFKYFEIILFGLGILTVYFLVKWIRKRKRQSNKTITIEEFFNNEYEQFKNDKNVFKHFDELSQKVNSRLRLEGIPDEIRDYCLAKKIIFDPNPGYGYYHFTPKGVHFFNLRSIEKIENCN